MLLISNEHYIVYNVFIAVIVLVIIINRQNDSYADIYVAYQRLLKNTFDLVVSQCSDSGDIGGASFK